MDYQIVFIILTAAIIIKWSLISILSASVYIPFSKSTPSFIFPCLEHQPPVPIVSQLNLTHYYLFWSHKFESLDILVFFTKPPTNAPIIRSLKIISPSPRPYAAFRKKLFCFSGEEFLALPDSEAGGPPLVGCPWLLRIYLPHLKAVSAIRKLRTCHTTVTKDFIQSKTRRFTTKQMS